MTKLQNIALTQAIEIVQDRQFAFTAAILELEAMQNDTTKYLLSVTIKPTMEKLNKVSELLQAIQEEG